MISKKSYRTEVHSATMRYQKVLALLQQEIITQNDSWTPLFIACIVLAAIEAIQRQLLNALNHLKGAYQILTNYITDSANSSRAKNDLPELYQLAMALDIQSSTYALDSPPSLARSEPLPQAPDSNFALGSGLTQNIHCSILSLLHTCYHFAVEASSYKYAPRHSIPVSVALEQGRLISLLSQWIAVIDRGLTTAQQPELLRHPDSLIVVLKLQCLSALIYLSTKLSPYELSYDTYIPFFEQIVDAADRILHPAQVESSSSPTSRFRLSSPCSQPLYLTAVKCRHPQLRRRALKLLSQTDRQGPWDADIHTATARRVIELEESEVTLNGHPTEAARLHGVGIDSDGVLYRQGGTLKLYLSRCLDVEQMLLHDTDGQASYWHAWEEYHQLEGGSYLDQSSLRRY
jgi:hypothetical protein